MVARLPLAQRRLQLVDVVGEAGRPREGGMLQHLLAVVDDHQAKADVYRQRGDRLGDMTRADQDQALCAL